MKVVFVCGALEPGRDGVGDYVRCLSGELINQGNEVSAVALNDFFISNFLKELQEMNGVTIPVLRLPSKWSEKERFAKAKEWVDQFFPDWISLQFVPFSFHPKGLPIGLTRCLVALGENRRWHIMFHELWVGMNNEASIKYACWGWLQRQIIKNLISRLRPSKIHTQCRVYFHQLNRLGYKADYLPLYGNIPVSFCEKAEHLFNNKSFKKTKKICFVLFGSIHSGAPMKEFTEEVALFASKNNIEVMLKTIGRCGNAEANLASIWRAAGLKIEILGEQSTKYISEVFKGSTIGLSTTPIAVIEKSGSVMAMLEHGLHVICICKQWHPKGLSIVENLPGTIMYKKGNLEQCLYSISNFPFTNKLSDISHQFANSLIK